MMNPRPVRARRTRVGILATALCALSSLGPAQPLYVRPKTVVALDRLSQWFGLRAPDENPITPAQLEAGALAVDSIARVRQLFEDAIARGLTVNARWIAPESGGEAVLDHELRLAEATDTRWAIVQALAAVAADPYAVARLVEDRAQAVARVDTHGLLNVSVARLRRGARNADDEIRRALLTVAQNAAASYEHDPEAQLALITSRDWQGRYVGRWHLHPPHDAGSGWSAGGEPSYEDMQNAIAAGQYLTLAFHPEGFDLYDASALGDLGRIDVSALKVIRYRSPHWRAHFETLHRKIRAAAPGPPRKPS